MQEQGEAITSEEKEAEDFEKEMEEYIFNADITSVNSEYRSNTGYEGMVNTAIAVVTAFDDDTKAGICRKFYDAMEEGGYFYIGHAESVPKDMPFVKVAPAIYRKLGGDKK